MKLNYRSFNRTRLAVALTLAFGSMTMMATPVGAQGTVKSSQTFDQDTTITVDGTYTTNQYAGIVAITNSQPSNVEVTMGAGKTLTISGDATNNGWGQLRGVVVWDKSSASVNGQTILNLKSTNQQIRGLHAYDATLKMNGDVGGVIESTTGQTVGIDAQAKSTLTIAGNTDLKLKSSGGRGLQAEGSSSLTLKGSAKGGCQKFRV